MIETIIGALLHPTIVVVERLYSHPPFHSATRDLRHGQKVLDQVLPMMRGEIQSHMSAVGRSPLGPMLQLQSEKQLLSNKSNLRPLSRQARIALRDAFAEVPRIIDIYVARRCPQELIVEFVLYEFKSQFVENVVLSSFKQDQAAILNMLCLAIKCFEADLIKEARVGVLLLRRNRKLADHCEVAERLYAIVRDWLPGVSAAGARHAFDHAVADARDFMTQQAPSQLSADHLGMMAFLIFKHRIKTHAANFVQKN